MNKKYMTVPEMRKLLGLQKTESYWLVKKRYFNSRVIGKQICVDIASFEVWYTNQIKYKKITGEEPGQELRKRSLSARDMANLLGISESMTYKIWTRQQLNIITVNHWKRLPIEEFERWYNGQNKYRRIDETTKRIQEKKYLSRNEAATIAQVSPSTITKWIQKGYFSCRVAGNTLRIPSKDFISWHKRKEQ